MSKRFLIILAALVVVFFGFITLNHNKKNKDGSSSASTQATNHVVGAGNKKVTLVEYGDYQCPSCGAYYSPIKQIVAKYGDDITFQFRNFPLTQIHQNAMAGHRAAEAAGKQNKYWEMHDMLYERQQSWSTASNPAQIMEDYATELALNVDQFKKDYNSSEVNSAINADIKAGTELKVSATPTFFLNGQKLTDTTPTVESFTKLIDAEIAKQSNQSNQ